MELDDLKAGWAELDRRLERMEARLAAAPARTGVRVELRRLVLGQWVQAAFGVLLAIAAGSFWVDHRATPNLLVAGLLLHGYGIAMIVAAARNLFLAGRVDESAPVLQLQRRIVSLRAWRIREGRFFGIVGCFMWVPMLVYAFGLSGLDIVAAQPVFFGLQLLAALLCLGIYAWVAKRQKAPEGSAVRRAAERLAEIRRFEANGQKPEA